MAMFGESGLPPGFHQDVMDALPEDKEGKKRLAEEIKGRAKGSLGSKNYPEAIALYSKAIEVMKDEAGEEGYVAILFANRSMCKLGMGRALEAETDATEAIERDASYVKGYYRKAMASIKLEKYESAKETLLAGLARKPEDKELTTQMDNVERLIKNPPKKAESAKKAAAKPATIPKVSAGAPVPKSVKEETVINDAPQSEADRIRGYKLTSDGRKTSYFNNEMDAKTKELIGDIAPKKISAPVSAAAEPVTTDKGSAWNAAGTFESKNLTKWAKDAIRDRCNKIVAGAGAGGDGSASASARVTSITSDGDAEIVSNRGTFCELCLMFNG